jgi:hypothetical protein
MTKILAYIRRIFRRKPQPSPRLNYIRQGDLPIDADELVRLGVVRPWRVMAATNEPWFSSERGALEWFIENLGGQADD